MSLPTLLPILFGLGAITALSWWYMFYLADNMDMPMMEMSAEMPMAGSMDSPWTLIDFGANFIMWAVMMVAMMVPSAAPTFLLYARLQRDQHGDTKVKPVALFLGGYLCAWTLFSLGATLCQWGLHEGALLSGAMAIDRQWLAAAVLMATGLYQWTPLKQACLQHCQSPLGFLLGFWRDDSRGIVRMGWRHGLFCVGCCWLLMAILFTVGVMNLIWVALIAVYVLLEKIVPNGQRFARISGVLLCGSAVVIAL
ncbi:MAG: DUF2182 domain-containing protein [Gammaproteobacteria bacterium]|nr:MAG: DUF2182 domain-containing protein [Gammaproteobacteria bacterium]RLA60621.1 MAG: DUF2182 domain-containing protein [Gammaproteobacteria bacterium]